MLESTFFIQPKNSKPEGNDAETKPLVSAEKKETPKDAMSRRSFMALLGASATIYGLAAMGYKFENKIEGEAEDETDGELEAIKNGYLEDKKKRQLDRARHYIEVDDMEVIGKTFQEQIETQQDHVTLDQATRNAIFHNWKEKYTPGTVNYRDGIVAGLERMQPWASEIKKIFKRHDVPEKYIYLSIAESHFSDEKISAAGAVGPYQITQETTRLKGFEMQVNDLYDERLDPLKSAELCAKHLRYSYERFGNSWDFAVLAYNGAFTEDFLRSLPEKEKHMPQEQISSQGAYAFRDGDMLSRIAEKYKTSLTLLWRKNAVTEEEKDMKNGFSRWVSRMEKSSKGELLDIPQERKISMDDFNAWLEKTINDKIQSELRSDSYEVRPKETLEKIAKKFHMDLAVLKSNNRDVHNRLLRVGQKMHIPLDYKRSPEFLLEVLSDFSENINYPGKFNAIVEIIKENHLDSILDNQQKTFLEVPLKYPSTLGNISRAYSMDIQKLLELNPAIKSAGTKLSRSFEVRVPNQYLVAKSDLPKKKN